MSTSAKAPASTKTSSSSSKRKESKVAPLPEVEPSEQNPAPFDDAVGYDLGGKQVNLAQLADEIKQATKYDGSVNLALGDSVLWMTPPGLDAQVVAETVAAHEPDPDWGIPGAIKDFNEALGRLRDKPEEPLTAADRDALIKGIALNFTALMPTPTGG